LTQGNVPNQDVHGCNVKRNKTVNSSGWTGISNMLDEMTDAEFLSTTAIAFNSGVSMGQGHILSVIAAC
jgi:hypothetical protein